MQAGQLRGRVAELESSLNAERGERERLRDKAQYKLNAAAQEVRGRGWGWGGGGGIRGIGWVGECLIA